MRDEEYQMPVMTADAEVLMPARALDSVFPPDSRAELAASARIVAAADDARRRIARDLHDGLQQQLVSLCLWVRVAQEAVPHDHQELGSELERIADGLNEAVECVREISRGVYPAALSEVGLGPVVKALARNSPVPVRLHGGVGGRLPGPVEVAAYYILSEALTNVVKHAQAAAVDVSIEQRERVLDLSVRDDGVGGADRNGSGLAGLADRVGALGGTIRLMSPPGGGTRLYVSLPVGPGSDRSRPSRPRRRAGHGEGP
jgi:signal transduction histidine kinase